MQIFPAEETTFLLNGAVGAIELLTTSPETSKDISTTVIVCHPHPLYGGTMQNKVVTTLARVFHDLGLHTVRFNFRGIGKTAGSYDGGRGETTDVITIANWVECVRPQDTLWLAGFSFGGFVAACAATQLNVARLVTVAPQISRFAEVDLSLVKCPWWVVQGEEDEVVKPEEVYAWVEKMQGKVELIRMEKAGHFFHGKLLELRDILALQLKQ